MEKVQKQELQYIAQLACLEIEDEKINEYQKNLEEILNFVNILNEVVTDEIDISVTTNNLSNRFRKDEVIDFKDKESLLQNAPEITEHMFKVPNVI